MTRALFAGVLVTAVLAAGLCLVPRSLALSLLDEGGWVERVELALYAACALLVARAPALRPRARSWILLVLLLLAALEVNPGGSVESLVDRQPAHGGDPVGVRPRGVLVLGGILGGALLGLALTAGGDFLAALRARRVAAWLTLAGALLVPLAILLDRYHDSRLVWNRGYRLGTGVSFGTHLAEELAEALTPGFFLAALLAGRRRRGKETVP